MLNDRLDVDIAQLWLMMSYHCISVNFLDLTSLLKRRII